MNLGIIGTGGLARETRLIINELINKNNFNYNNVFFIEFDEHYNSNLKDLNVLKLSECDFNNFHFVIAVADCKIRERIYLELKDSVNFTSIISPNSYLSPDIKYKDGLIVMPFCYLTCNIDIGKHAIINASCSIGHDTKIGNFFTLTSNSTISGNNLIKNRVFIGANSSTIQGVTIESDVKIGINSTVIRNIKKKGTYFGSPVKFLM